MIQVLQNFPEANGSLPASLYRLVDPSAPVDLPPPGAVKLSPSDNRELDKLVAALGRSKLTWKRAIVLHEWLLSIGHKVDDRLCTSLIRVCAQHGQVAKALWLYDWMRRPVAEGGAGLQCTVYTYTAAMRAALSANMLDRAAKVWDHAEADHGHEIDCRLCTTMIEVCSRRGETDRALQLYKRMTSSPSNSKMAPSVHAYTAAMRAATEGGRWEAALSVWRDMCNVGCKPTGHAYSAVISACAFGGEWRRAVSLFDEMLGCGIKPDVVSCTSLITALGSDGQWERAEKVVEWMKLNDIRPNVRTYTALVGALSTACQWEKAIGLVEQMKSHAFGPGVEPNAYTYSALLKALGDHGEWQLAEEVFGRLEAEQLSFVKVERPEDQQTNEAKEDHFSDRSIPIDGHQESTSIDAITDRMKTSCLDDDDGGDDTESPEERQAAAAVVSRTVEIALSNSYEEPSLIGGAESLGQTRSGYEDVGAANAFDNGNNIVPIVPSTSSFSYFSTSIAADGPSSATGHPSERTNGRGFDSFNRTSGAEGAPSDKELEKRYRQSAWTIENAATQGLHLELDLNKSSSLGPKATASVRVESGSSEGTAAAKSQIVTSPKSEVKVNAQKSRSVVNEVVCGALMMAYEKSGKWEHAVGVLDRARGLGVVPNTVMYNTAISALGKARQTDKARELFNEMSCRDAVTYETMIAAYGMIGNPVQAEEILKQMDESGFQPQDFAFCGLVAAYSFQGNWRAALGVQARAARAGVPPSVHMYNALIAACDRAQQFERALALSREMKELGIAPNGVTRELMLSVCQEGVRAVENQQAAVAALSAAVAAAGTVMMRTGIF